MQRDMDLIRRMVLAVRDAEWPLGNLPGVTPDAFVEHAKLLAEAGFVEAAFETKGRPVLVRLRRHTWAGQQFADSIVSDPAWQTTVSIVVKRGGSWTVGVLAEVAKGVVANMATALLTGRQ